MSLNTFLTILLLVLSIPAGFLIAWLARDELVQGRTWFQRIMVLALVGGVVLFFFKEYTGALSCFFIIIVAFISYRKSFDTKWTKTKFK